MVLGGSAGNDIWQEMSLTYVKRPLTAVMLQGNKFWTSTICRRASDSYRRTKSLVVLFNGDGDKFAILNRILFALIFEISYYDPKIRRRARAGLSIY
jgi:hypothetical protein